MLRGALALLPFFPKGPSKPGRAPWLPPQQLSRGGRLSLPSREVASELHVAGCLRISSAEKKRLQDLLIKSVVQNERQARSVALAPLPPPFIKSDCSFFLLSSGSWGGGVRSLYLQTSGRCCITAAFKSSGEYFRFLQLLRSSFLRLE